MVMQIVSFALSAVYSGIWFLRWAIHGVKRRMWVQLGWFSGLVCAGSVAGAVAWGARMQRRTAEYKFKAAGSSTPRHYYVTYSTTYRLDAAFFIVYGLEFLCLIIPKLIMLRRLTNNATCNDSGIGGASLVRACRVTAAVAVLCSVGGWVALVVAGVHYVQVADLYDRAAAACDAQGNETASSAALFQQRIPIFTTADTATSVQSIFEVIALFLVSAAFLILAPLSVAMFRRAELQVKDVTQRHSMLPTHTGTASGREERVAEALAVIGEETIEATSEQRRRIVIACVVVLVTFPVRAAFDLLNAYSLFYDPYNNACGPCSTCQSESLLINTWLDYTPELQPIVVALSSPLPLFVSLWIITGAQARAIAIVALMKRARLGTGSSGSADSRTPLVS